MRHFHLHNHRSIKDVVFVKICNACLAAIMALWTIGKEMEKGEDDFFVATNQLYDVRCEH